MDRDIDVRRTCGDRRGVRDCPVGAAFNCRPANLKIDDEVVRRIAARNAEDARDEAILVAIRDLLDGEVARVEGERAGQNVCPAERRVRDGLDGIGEGRARREARKRGGVGLRERRICSRHREHATIV